MPFTYEYPRPAVTVDCVVFGLDQKKLEVLVIKRAENPFKGRWALPGGFVHVQDGADQGEDIEFAASRVLSDETGLNVSYLEQLYTFGTPGRDPRGRVISVAYYALIRSKDHVATAGSEARDVRWISVPVTAKLAFDHSKILKMALGRLRAKVRYAPIGFNLLPAKFTLPQLQEVYEAILQRPLDKRNFRKRVLNLGLLVECGVERPEGRSGPSAALYRFDKRAYDQAVRDGFNFEM